LGAFYNTIRSSTVSGLGFSKLNSYWYTNGFPGSSGYVSPWTAGTQLIDAGDYGSYFLSSLGATSSDFYWAGGYVLKPTYNGTSTYYYQLGSIQSTTPNVLVNLSSASSDTALNNSLLKTASDRDYILEVTKPQIYSDYTLTFKTYKNKVAQATLVVPSSDQATVETSFYNNGKFYVLLSKNSRKDLYLIKIADGDTSFSSELVYSAAATGQNYFGAYAVDSGSNTLVVFPVNNSPRRKLYLKVKTASGWQAEQEIPALVTNYDYYNHPHYGFANNKIYMVFEEKLSGYRPKFLVKVEINATTQAISSPEVIKTFNQSNNDTAVYDMAVSENFLNIVARNTDNNGYAFLSIITNKLSEGTQACGNGLASGGNYCNCPVGQFFNRDNSSCVNICPAGTSYYEGRCACADASQVYNNRTKACEAKCSGDLTWDAGSQSCICSDPNAYWNGSYCEYYYGGYCDEWGCY
jgi:hypothetical protein